MAQPVAHLLILALAASSPAWAGADPTRPPPGFSEHPSEQSAKPPETPLLVSGVFLVGKAAYATVDGQTVRVGDHLGEAMVVTQIDESGVWLKTPTGLRQLRLLPQVKKTPAAQAGTEKGR